MVDITNPLNTKKNKKVEERQICSLLELRHPSSSAPDIRAPGSQAFRLRSVSAPSAPNSQAFRLELNHPTGSPETPACRWESWDFPGEPVCIIDPLLSLYVILVLSLWRTLTTIELLEFYGHTWAVFIKTVPLKSLLGSSLSPMSMTFWRCLLIPWAFWKLLSLQVEVILYGGRSQHLV